ncbi:MAG TPA: response regulator transcription factor [Blastocatellia bacterium]|nr:response regulator transcription factor [Blastocatellia bacterium]
MKTETRMVIADDHAIFRKGLRAVIEAEKGLVVIAEAANGEEALRNIEELRPDVAILDVDMPNMDGFQVVKELGRRRIRVECIFLTIHSEQDVFNEAMNLGVKGYVLKDSSSTDIVNAIHALRQGHHYISPSITTHLISRTDRARSLGEKIASVNDLTPTERRILQMIADYKTSKQIAEQLCIHYRTVENHRTNISAKLGLRGSHSLIKFALKHQQEL